MVMHNLTTSNKLKNIRSLKNVEIALLEVNSRITIVIGNIQNLIHIITTTRSIKNK